MVKKEKLPEWATTVTPFSKGLALFMLVVFPVIGFYYGMYYQQQIDKHEQATVPTQSLSHTIPSPVSSNGKISCNTNADCPANYFCAQAGPIRAGGQNHKSCWKKGSVLPL